MSLVFLELGQLKIELSRLNSTCAIKKIEFSRFVSEQRVESAQVVFFWTNIELSQLNSNIFPESRVEPVQHQ